MKNFDADQQNDMFKNQSIVQGLFTDIAAENAFTVQRFQSKSNRSVLCKARNASF